MKVTWLKSGINIVEAVNRAIGPVLIEFSVEEANSLGSILDSFVDAMSQHSTTAYKKEVELAEILIEKLSNIHNVVELKKK